MFQKKFIFIFVWALVLCSGAFATEGIPEPSFCTVHMLDGASLSVALYNLPNGSGSAFVDAQIMGDGAVVDATIELTVVDSQGAPVVGFPAEDMWLASTNGGMVPCIGGTTADQDTDSLGVTFWAAPLLAGGSDAGTCDVVISGSVVGAFSLAFNSPDINGDGFVNLADVGLFAIYLSGPYNFAGDFFADGNIDLADVGRLALGISTSCP